MALGFWMQSLITRENRLHTHATHLREATSLSVEIEKQIRQGITEVAKSANDVHQYNTRMLQSIFEKVEGHELNKLKAAKYDALQPEFSGFYSTHFVNAIKQDPGAARFIRSFNIDGSVVNNKDYLFVMRDGVNVKSIIEVYDGTGDFPVAVLDYDDKPIEFSLMSSVLGF